MTKGAFRAVAVRRTSPALASKRLYIERNPRLRGFLRFRRNGRSRGLLAALEKELS